MSKTGAIFIKAVDINFEVYDRLLNRLLDAGWSTNKRGRLFYMIDESFDWVDASLDDFSLVMNDIERSISANYSTCLDLVFLKTSISIGFNFLDSNTIMFSISESIQMIESNWVIDFSWYIEKISVIFEELQSFSIECLYG
jgi:hypothetical protein